MRDFSFFSLFFIFFFSFSLAERPTYRGRQEWLEGNKGRKKKKKKKEKERVKDGGGRKRERVDPVFACLVADGE